MINGTRPMVGKQVYDMHLGYGKNVSVEPDMAFVVEYSNNRHQRFSSGGFLGQVRRIYWENPVVVEPLADDPGWQTFVNISRQMYTLIKKARGKN